jgi:hypothetical protein
MQFLKDVEKIGKKVGLKINETKTKVMRINTSKMEANLNKWEGIRRCK